MVILARIVVTKKESFAPRERGDGEDCGRDADADADEVVAPSAGDKNEIGAAIGVRDDYGVRWGGRGRRDQL